MIDMHPNDLNYLEYVRTTVTSTESLSTIRELIDWTEQQIELRQTQEAALYIKNNRELLNEDVSMFLNNCPGELLPKLYNMLMEAGIDLSNYATAKIKFSIKDYMRRDIHDHNN